LRGLVERAPGRGGKGFRFCGHIDQIGATGRPSGKPTQIGHKHHDIQHENDRPDDKDQNTQKKLDHRKSQCPAANPGDRWSRQASVGFKASAF
jgi:hypothetical protein